MPSIRFSPPALPESAAVLRGQVRAFLARTLPGVPADVRAQSWMAFDRDFSRKLGAAGFIGMTWPKRYGGHERSALERYVVMEELLAAGAPVGAHWVADRQSGPLILRLGTEEQRQFFLPAIARGELYFGIGMSEPDSGSDLASVRARARKVAGGFRLDGRKIWTSFAHVTDYIIGLFRTEGGPENRHVGLTQFIIDIRAPGITVRPIRALGERHGFNEVLFEDVFVPDNRVIGEVGNGWAQVMAELSYERSGPERFLSCYRLLAALTDEVGTEPGEADAVALGEMCAELIALRAMSLSVSERLATGEDPALEAAIVKDLGTVFEQALPERAHALHPVAPGTKSDYATVLEVLTLSAPSFSLRGGTREILRGIIARGLGLR